MWSLERSRLRRCAASLPRPTPPPRRVSAASRRPRARVLQGEKLAAEYGVQFFETSAKADLNVETAFEGIAREVPGASLVIAGLGE